LESAVLNGRCANVLLKRKAVCVLFYDKNFLRKKSPEREKSKAQQFENEWLILPIYNQFS